MSRDIEAARAFFRIFADDSQFRRVLTSVQQTMSNLGSSLQNIGTRLAASGAVITAPLTAAALTFASVGSALSDMEVRTGVGAEALSAFGYAARQIGTDMETVEKSIRKMQQGIGSAAPITAALQSSFDRLGLSMEQLQGLSPEEQFLTMGEAIGAIEDPTQRAATAMDIFGRGGTKIMEMLTAGRQGMAEWAAEASRLGIVMDSETAAAGDVLDDSIASLRDSLKGVTLQLGAALAPALTGIVQTITSGVAVVIEFIRANQGLVQMVAVVGASLVGAGTAFIGLGLALKGVAIGIGVLSSTLGAIGGLIGVIVSPIGLVVVALASMGAAFSTHTDAGRGAISQLVGAFHGLVAEVGASLKLAGQLLAAGELQVAAELMWSQLKLIWLRGTQSINETFAEWGTFAWQVLIEARANIQGVWAGLVAWIREIWADLWGGIRLTILEVSNFFRSVWSGTLNAIAGLYIRLRGLFDSGFDTQGALDALKTAADAAAEARADSKDDRRNAIIDERNARMKEIEQQRTEALNEIERRRQAATEANFVGRDDRMKALDDEIRAAQEAFADATARAQEAVARHQEEAEQKRRDAAAGAEEAAGQASGRGDRSVVGTFSAALAAQLVGGDRTPQKQLDELKQQNKWMKVIAENTSKNVGGAVFT